MRKQPSSWCTPQTPTIMPWTKWAFSLGLLLCFSALPVGCSRRATDPGAASAVGTLGVGDPAPPLNIGQWMNGQPSSAGFEGNVHVVEFWATWCGPCLISMPHLSELKQDYGDQVTIIGITDEDEGTVEAFLASESPDGRSWFQVIQYYLATDNRGATNAAYMAAADQQGIPTAFIVGKRGTIEWIGHPGRIDEPLRQAIEGS